MTGHTNLIALPDDPRLVESIEGVRDFYIYDRPDLVSGCREAFCYSAAPDTHFVKGTPAETWIVGLLNQIRTNHGTEEDFSVRYGNYIFRGHRDRTVAGDLIALRRTPSVTPRLEDLQFNPAIWRELFMLPSLVRGGLIVIAAVTGQGKSTTVGAIVRSRLERYGGFCRTVEDQPELPLHGTHGAGQCIQTAVDTSLPIEIGYATALRKAMRSYPSIPSGGTMCMVGEVRDAPTAAEVVRAAVNGHLVITTVHASDTATALARLYSLAESAMDSMSARDLLAAAVRIVLHQDLRVDHSKKGWAQGTIGGELLYSGGPSSAVGNIIRSGSIAGALASVVSMQSILQRKSPPLQMHELLKRMDNSTESKP